MGRIYNVSYRLIIKAVSTCENWYSLIKKDLPKIPQNHLKTVFDIT